MPKILLSILFFTMTINSSFAGGVLRLQQMKAQRQRQAQMEYEQAQSQAYQQQNASVPGGQQPDGPVTYQQQVEQRNRVIAQAIYDAHGNVSQPPKVSPEIERQSKPADQEETVDLAEVWKKLDNKSAIWGALADDQAKLLTVAEYLDRFHKEGVKINEPPAHYVQMIDQASKENPQMLQRPFGELLQILAIIDYDFDNGVDKDLLARKVLGEAGYQKNKARMSQQAADRRAQ